MLYQGREIKVLVIYPKPAKAIAERRAKLGLPEIPINELEYGQDEVDDLVNRLDAQILSGKRATLTGLLDKVSEGWDIVWLITHADPDGWYLNDGIVSASETTTLIRASGAFLTVMNTCSSKEVAEAAALELGTPFICTIKPVPDRQAFITGAIFAQKLAAGFDIREAYEEAKPGQNSTYEYIEARYEMAPPQDRGRYVPPNQPNQGGGLPDTESINRLSRSIEDLNRIVLGDQHLGLRPLRELFLLLDAELKTVKADISKILAELDRIHAGQVVRTRVFWIMGLIILALMITVGIMASQMGGT